MLLKIRYRTIQLKMIVTGFVKSQNAYKDQVEIHLNDCDRDKALDTAIKGHLNC